MQMTIKSAEAIAGPLGSPSKMPGKSYGLPAAECRVGSRLRQIDGSTCARCYALRGHYQYDNVLTFQYRRLEAIDHPQWVDAMVYLFEQQVDREDPYFRWHDSGDLQSMAHLDNICEIARRVRWCRFWLPTRETAIVRGYLRIHGPFPPNLPVRVSAAMVDAPPPTGFPYTSTVHRANMLVGLQCAAPARGNQCASCRACWQRYRNISYRVHEEPARYSISARARCGTGCADERALSTHAPPPARPRTAGPAVIQRENGCGATTAPSCTSLEEVFLAHPPRPLRPPAGCVRPHRPDHVARVQHRQCPLFRDGSERIDGVVRPGHWTLKPAGFLILGVDAD